MNTEKDTRTRRAELPFEKRIYSKKLDFLSYGNYNDTCVEVANDENW